MLKVNPLPNIIPCRNPSTSIISFKRITYLFIYDLFVRSVIKVEKPTGDLFRKTLLDYEKMRKSGSAFAMSNYSKLSITLDLNEYYDLETLEWLLKDTDVIITSMLPKG